MFSAARHATLAAASLAAVLAFTIVGPAGGAGKGKPGDTIAPSAPSNVRVVSATPTTVTVTWDAATDDVGVVGYYVHSEGGRARVDGTRATVGRLECGTSTGVWVVAFDRSRNRSEQAGAVVSTAACPDLQPPSSPSGFRQEATTQTSVVLTWNPSTDNVGVVGYGIYRGAVIAGTTAQPNTTLTQLQCGTSYEYALDAFDAAGNRSLRRSAWVRTAECTDGAAPSVPANLAVTSSTVSSISVKWDPSTDNVAVAGYRVSVDGTAVSTVVETAATLSGFLCGQTHVIAVDAYDAARNRSQAAVISAATTACVAPPPPPPPPAPSDTTPPSPPTGLALDSVTKTSVSLRWNAATDNVGVQGYGVYRNGTRVQTESQPLATVAQLACGTGYTLEVDAYDAAGNRSTRVGIGATTAACTDTQAPSAPTNVAATSRTATSIALSWTASTDNSGVSGYGLYRGGVAVGTANETSGIFANLTCNTNYTLAVDAYDAAGNRSAKTTVMVSTTACADTTPPSMPTGLAVSNVSTSGLTLSWSGSTDNVGVTGYDVYRGGSKVASVTTTSSAQTGLGCGTSYAFGVIARDAAGNSSQQAALNVATAPCAPAPPPPPPPPPTEEPYFFDSFASSQPFASWSYEPSYDPTLHRSVTGVADQAIGLRTTPTSWGPNSNSQNSNIYLHPNIAHAGWLNGRVLGQDTWYRVRMRFPSDYEPASGDWNWLVIWHDDDETQNHGANSFALGISNGRLWLRPAGGSSTSPTYGSVLLAPIVRDHWYELMFHFVWHTSSSIGRYEMWVDGGQVASANFPTLYMNPSGNHSYNTFDLLNYHSKTSQVSEVHFDEVKIGPSRNSVGG